MRDKCDKAGRAGSLRVAVVEDDALLREKILLPGLADYGFEAAGFDSAAALYRRMLVERFDIVVLDIGLPDEDGLSVARHLREVSRTLGIVVLTGNRGRTEHVQALSDGADAFLSKPVDCEVLAVTLHSLARRLESAADGSMPAATNSEPRHWRLATDGWCLIAPSGGMLALTMPERSLLSVLDASRGQPVGREALIAALSDEVSEFDPHRLEMLVHRLRRKAGTISTDDPPLPLLAARGVGYLLA
ncbi:response regulator transcription factor [Pseudoxanthomonas putridarboris]|uniref:Response regulator transcription factor n=1 Tax=Pseudoxanthomonas putridarboris TaxID=752605 RepID=A0ABU9J5G9_9GAMM